VGLNVGSNRGVERATGAPGFVLTTADALGTLAATRCLGENGVPILVFDSRRFAPAAWSRYVVHREACPKVRPVGRFIDALTAFGARNPGHVLYATSDDLAWAFAQRETLLRKSFHLLTPPFACMERLLDKRELYAACGEAGLGVPNTWFPEGDADVERATRTARFPVIIKPRSQVFFTSARKGIVVTCAGDLRSRYSAFARDNGYEAAIVRERPSMARPMIQEIHSEEPIYSVSGFCDPRRGLFVARGARKTLQWPRRAGIGIAFEDAPLQAPLAEAVRRLCDLTGFFGVFEAEFVDTGDAMRLIDFNPRFFNQIGFDVARGLPSPYFAYLLALGETAMLDVAVGAAQRWRSEGAAVFRHRTMIALTRTAERLAGRAPAGVATAVAKGETGNGASIVVEAAIDGRDWLPGLVDGVQQVGSALTHPRSTFRAASRGYG
jgi:D-aspartate ligase